MRKILRIVTAAIALAIVAGCSGVPVALGTRSSVAMPDGAARTITAEACGFQLLLFIPISINSRLARAYQDLEKQAGSDYITDVEVQERWQYAFVGTSYCTKLQAKAVGRQ
jgi:hypothetical protein